MRRLRKRTRPFPFKLLLCAIIAILPLLIYASSPNDKKAIHKDKTFSEQLEYSNIQKKQPEHIKPVALQKKEEQSATVPAIPKFTINQLPTSDNESNTAKIAYQEPLSIKPQKTNVSNGYDLLLNSLKDYPIYSISSVENIVNKLLTEKGYPSGTIKISADTTGQMKSKSQGSFMVATFEFPTGDLKINTEQIFRLNNKEVIAILAHELDHFDKFAKVCKTMGYEDFKNFLEENGSGVLNDEFWIRASYYANTKGFDANKYTKSIKRYLNQNKLELTSSYSDFYRLAENIRNPLEESAYSVSDYIQKYYGIPISEGPIKQISKKFNEIDKALDTILLQNSFIKEEKIPLFDYFFSKAIIKTAPVFQDSFEKCINEYDGNLTLFWLDFERILSDFYLKGQLDSRSVSIILTLLSTTLEEIKLGITNEQIADALKYKVKTLIPNIVYPNAVSNIRKTSLNYLKFIKERNITNPKTELDFVLTLMCIENELYTNNQKEINLYYIKMPEELSSLYNIQNKYQRHNFIYNNSEFKNLLEKGEIKSEQALLVSLLDSHRLNIRIQK